MRRTLAAACLLSVIAGCEPAAPVADTNPPQAFGSPANHRPPASETQPPESPAGPRRVEPSFLDITPAARAQLRKTADEYAPGRRWWLRVHVQSGGCTGMSTKLDFDPIGPETGDAEFLCGDIRCVMTAKHDFLIQGTVIDWVENGKERGFSLKPTNVTEENRRKASAWIADEARARGLNVEIQPK